MFETAKVAAVSFKPTKWDKAGNADRMEAIFTAAAVAKPGLILLPEGVLEGYAVMDVIDIPALPSQDGALQSEREYLDQQGGEMQRRYEQTMTRVAEESKAGP